ncbi:peptide pheromone inhibitor Ipd, partial [Staphylococcus aureus]|nr:peptide pheromone inhibitor Ipd [Staphylococcus aureus]
MKQQKKHIAALLFALI